MTRIKLLPEAVVNKIAAGEVVERPASVVKELIENALDAGARTIRITVNGAGKKLIRVDDDGVGMERDDLLLAFERHSTSKLQNFSDLDNLTTLGFRGEALPSIAGVSDLEISSRPEGVLTATRVHLRGGKVRAVSEAGAPIGTTVQVRRLFFNTPARRKFLKTPRTELAHISEEIISHALAHPSVAFFYRQEGEMALEAPAAASLRQRLGDIWGKEATEGLLALKSEEDNFSLRGLISPPSRGQTSRKGLSIFVNLRPVQNRMIYSAVLNGYGPRLPQRRYPSGVVFIDISGPGVDVNIHPTKKEVKFSRPAVIRKLVAAAVSNAVREGRPYLKSPRKKIPRPSRVREPVFELGYSDGQKEMDLTEAGSLMETSELFPPETAGFRVVGQVGDSYLIVQSREGMLIIDQHAAHERVLYEKFAKELTGEGIGLQPLLAPINLDPGPRQAALIAERIPLLRQLGIEIEPFGRDAFIITSLPALLNKWGKEELVLNVLGDIEDWEKSPEDPRDAIIIRLACLAAVKAGSRVDGLATERLLEKLFQCRDPEICPHGRPTLIEYGWDDLEKMFGRK